MSSRQRYNKQESNDKVMACLLKSRKTRKPMRKILRIVKCNLHRSEEVFYKEHIIWEL